MIDGSLWLAKRNILTCQMIFTVSKLTSGYKRNRPIWPRTDEETAWLSLKMKTILIQNKTQTLRLFAYCSLQYEQPVLQVRQKKNPAVTVVIFKAEFLCLYFASLGEGGNQISARFMNYVLLLLLNTKVINRTIGGWLSSCQNLTARSILFILHSPSCSTCGMFHCVEIDRRTI